METVVRKYIDDVLVWVFIDEDNNRRVTLTDEAGHIRWETVALAVEYEINPKIRDFLRKYLD